MAWQIDAAHTTISFAVRHMGLATVRGHFARCSGSLDLRDARPTDIELTVDAGSIDTREAQRDQHLRSADFLYVEKYPSITFHSRESEPLSGGRYRILGDLTIRGVTRQVELETEVTQVVPDPWGNQRVGISATGTIDRKEWGLVWNQVLELGALLVGDQVRLTVDAEAIQAKAA